MGYIYIVVRGVVVQLQVCLRLACICPMDVLRVVVPGIVVPRVVVPDVVVPGVVSALFGMTPMWPNHTLSLQPIPLTISGFVITIHYKPKCTEIAQYPFLTEPNTVTKNGIKGSQPISSGLMFGDWRKACLQPRPLGLDYLVGRHCQVERH